MRTTDAFTGWTTVWQSKRLVKQLYDDAHELLYDVCERMVYQFIDWHLLRILQNYSE
jgi:hypothetical protein